MCGENQSIQTGPSASVREDWFAMGASLHCTSVLFLLLVGSNFARADTLKFTCDTSRLKADSVSHLRIDRIEIAIAKNFNNFSASIEHTLVDGTVVPFPPYSHHYYLEGTGDFTWATSPDYQPDGKHYVGTLLLSGDGAFLTESVADARCTVKGCHESRFDIRCEPE